MMFLEHRVASDADRSRSTGRPLWRWALIAYAAALTTATHWPRLKLGDDAPATDKELHVIAFAAATILLWLARWPATLPGVALVAVLWAGFDELTQAIPIVQRTCTWLDFLANVLGVAMATLGLWLITRLWRR